MEIAEIMQEVRKLPDDELLALAAQVDEEAARAVDHRLESLVREGRFDEMAAEALRDSKEMMRLPMVVLVRISSSGVRSEVFELV